MDQKQLKTFAPKIAGGVLILIALTQAWSGWERQQEKALETATAAARSAVAEQVGAAARSQLQNMELRRERASLIAALQEGQIDTARDVIGEGWSGLEASEFHAPDLAAAYGDPAAFGYGKLAVLETALNDNAVRLAVVKDGGAAKLAIAAPVMDEGRLLQLAYARLSLEPLLAPVAGAVPQGGYLALRQGRHTLAEFGDSEYANRAEADAITVDGTPLRVVAASPLVSGGLLGMNGMGEFGLAGVLILAGIAVIVLGGRKPRSADAGDAAAPAGAPTLAELQRSGQLSSTAPEAAPVKRPEKAAAPKLALERSIFRAYDIRGVVGSTLDVSIARLIGQAIGSVMHERGAQRISVGRDGRLSSPEMAAALIDGLRSTGRDVVDIGEAATPLAYFAAHHLRTGSCVSVTGSHNPPDYNGFKIVIDGDTLSGAAVQDLYARIAENRLHLADAPGSLEQRNINDDYIQRIAGDIQIERKLKVVVDCGSGVAGAVVPQLMAALGVEVEALFCEVDGTFPHHHPDPSDPANLQDLINVVKRVDADIGLAFDGDGDRLGVVTREGNNIFADRLLMLFADDVLERNPGAVVVYDVKCTGRLAG
ncbi:MAG TPA: phosphomannomutase/phosphoglucomutase, partial [Arenimonas sp.]|nr:phosphomannomutase/phosphoglucomutase [Arenimonas sp.]